MLSVFIGLVLISTTYDVLAREDKTKHPNKLLITFSVYTNGMKLFKVAESSTKIDCLEGLKSLSVLLIILFHRFELHHVETTNAQAFREFFKSYNITYFVWEVLCIDTLLTISGVLCAMQILTALEKKAFNTARLLVYHYMRYTPVLVAATLCFVSLLRHVKAPYTDFFREGIEENSEKYWWTILLQVQNYVNPDNKFAPHSWYLSVDFQLFAISLLLIYPAMKNGWNYLWSLPVLAIAGTIYVVKVCVDNDFMFNMLNASSKFKELVYIPTHARCAPWLIGMVLGYIIFKTKDKEIKMNKFLDAVLWFLSIAAINFIIGLFYRFVQFENNETSFMENAVFLAAQRLLWSLPICWIIFASHKLKSGGIIRWFLSLPEWQPLGRLSMSMYIIHIFYQILHSAYAKDPKNFEVTSMVRFA